MSDYIEKIKNWCQLKVNLHTLNRKRYQNFSERDILWCSVGLNVGYEISGKGESFARPVLVYKKINHELFFGLPLTKTSKKREGWYFYNKQQGYIVFEQMRVFSTRRIQSRYKKISKGDFSAITLALLNYMSPKYQSKR